MSTTANEFVPSGGAPGASKMMNTGVTEFKPSGVNFSLTAQTFKPSGAPAAAPKQGMNPGASTFTAAPSQQPAPPAKPEEPPKDKAEVLL